MTAAEPILRPAARVLLVDARQRVLLFRGVDPDRTAAAPFWFTVGGGLDEGESAVDGALRETAEETGLRLSADDLIGPVWSEVAEFPFEGRCYRQAQDFFVARVESWKVDTSAFDQTELRSIDGHHWWSVSELDRTTEVYYPAELPSLLRSVLGAVN